MLHAARLAQRQGIAQDDLTDQILEVLRGLDLPTEIPSDLDPDLIRQAMGYDKKKTAGKLRWVLPVRIGEVITGIPVENNLSDIQMISGMS